MIHPKLSSVIAIDTAQCLIHFYSKNRDDKSSYRHDVESYSANPFDDEFFEKFAYIINNYRKNNPTVSLDRPALVLPNHVFCTDTVTIPTVSKRLVNNSLSLAINSVYKDSANMKFNCSPIFKSRDNITYSLVGMRRELLQRIYKVCNDNKLSVSGITFSANATLDAALAINTKLKASSFLLVDIKENATSFVFALKGVTFGFYDLPFGYSVLESDEVVPQSSLFDHSAAKLLILNAKERAQAKQLTTAIDESDPDIEDEGFCEDSDDPRFSVALPKLSFKDDVVRQNFKIFERWILDIIASNSSITEFAPPEAVYVNIPRSYAYLLEEANAEEENGIKFVPLSEGVEKNPVLSAELDVVGGLYMKNFNRINNF